MRIVQIELRKVRSHAYCHSVGASRRCKSTRPRTQRSGRTAADLASHCASRNLFASFRWRASTNVSSRDILHHLDTRLQSTAAGAKTLEDNDERHVILTADSEGEHRSHVSRFQDGQSWEDICRVWLDDDAHLASEPHPEVLKELRAGHKFYPEELLRSRGFLLRLMNFLSSDAKIASFYTCATFDLVLPRLAPVFGLTYRGSDKQSHTYHSSGNVFSSYLVKTGLEKVAGQVDVSIVEEHIKSSTLSANLFQFLEDLEPTTGDRLLMLLNNHRELLLAACRGSAEAMPSLSILYDDGKAGSLDANDAVPSIHRPQQIVLANDSYNILVTRSFEASECTRWTFARALVEYCQRIHTATQQGTKGNVHFDGDGWHPSEFLAHATRALSWGEITYTEELALPLSADPMGPDNIWQSEIHTKDRGRIGLQVRWVGRKAARLLNMTMACVELKAHLQAAYKAGSLLPSNYQRFATYWGEDVSIIDETSVSKKSRSLPTVNPVSVDSSSISSMLDVLRQLREMSFESSSPWVAIDRTFDTTPYMPKLHLKGAAPIDRLDTHARSARITAERASLPVSQPFHRCRIIRAVANNDVVIIKAATGSGKTTQIPQFLFDDMSQQRGNIRVNVVCTQPRRVSAISVARRVAKERGQSLRHQVGYQVRFDDKSALSQNAINYMTSGYLLRLLEQDPMRLLSTCSHIVIDEVHERDIDTDLILTAFKNIMLHRPAETAAMPKLILMSATIDTNFFINYFQKISKQITITSVEVPGRTYPVQASMLEFIFPLLEATYPSEFKSVMSAKGLSGYIEKQLQGLRNDASIKSSPEPHDRSMQEEDADSDEQPTETLEDTLTNLYVPVPLIVLLINHLSSTSDTGDILVFLPGLSEIEHLERSLLESRVSTTRSSMTKLFKLHSSLFETNYDVFDPVPPGYRRIILSTNIAETSITLPDVRFVIDTGYSRQNSYDQTTQAGSFGMRWISRAEIAQRRGRAGRTQPGQYFATFSQAQYESMPVAPRPEILRTNLDQVLLRLEASTAFDVKTSTTGLTKALPGHVLSLAPSPPDILNIEAANHQLQRMHAFTDDGQVTPMGKVLSQFATTPAAAKTILLGLIFRCLDPLLLMGSIRDDCPIMNHPEKTGDVSRVRKSLAAESDDDRIADMKGFFLYDRACRQGSSASFTSLRSSHFIRHDTYHEMAQTANQIYQTIRTMLGVSRANVDATILVPKRRFPITPCLLNTNSSNDSLIKALSLSTSGTRLAIWGTNNWRGFNYDRILPTPRSVNHATHRRDYRIQRLRREAGDVLAYGSLRILPQDRYPWACDSSVVSPLTAMLFGESLRQSGDDVLIVNDWASYKIQVEGKNAKHTSALATKIILEYRKALDRFIAFAMSQVALDPRRLELVRRGKVNAEDFNSFFQEADHPLRKVFVDSVIEILNVDTENRKQRADARRLDAELAVEDDTTPRLKQSMVTKHEMP